MKSIGIINPFNSVAINLSVEKNNQYLVDPKRYADFTVQRGEKSSSNGILGGVLDQKDYDSFIRIIKNINMLDASHNEINQVRRQLTEAGLMDNEVSSTMAGPAAFVAFEKPDYDKKYNQLGYQHEKIPRYAGKEYDQVRSKVIDAFKIVTAIANASPATGQTISSDIFYTPENSENLTGVQVDISEFAKRLAAGEVVDKTKEPDLIEVIKALQLAEELRQKSKQES